MGHTEGRATEPEPQSEEATAPDEEAKADGTDTTRPDGEATVPATDPDTDATSAEPEGRSDPAPPCRRRRWRWARHAALALVLALLLPLLAAETALRVNYSGDPVDGARTRGRDAIWLGHAWVDGRKTDADVAALAEQLGGTGIRDLYVHAGPLEHDGTLPAPAYRNARRLIPAVHRALPGVRVQAWLGDVLATESPDGLRLERARTRAVVVASTRQILAAGFDGVHFDLEPLHSGDRNYLALLDDLRALTRAHHVLLSVAAHQIDPLPAFHSLWGTLVGHPKWWSQAYFGQVARRVDQIAVMSYDTMQPLQSLYGGYVAQQTSLALEATPPTTDLLMGLPFFHENRFGHRASAETVPAAARGVRLGLSRTDADRARFGVALYVDFAATEADWTAYRTGWVRP
ncbi:glycosyl hydrolase family 18 protein [Streptomyces nodosus]|uniref:glycosyl hydrolase family 18 protein n=1 Tax=Streptomyces nodosus TaxID=40318 RepID=UPI0036EEFC71